MHPSLGEGQVIILIASSIARLVRMDLDMLLVLIRRCHCWPVTGHCASYKGEPGMLTTQPPDGGPHTLPAWPPCLPSHAPRFQLGCVRTWLGCTQGTELAMHLKGIALAWLLGQRVCSSILTAFRPPSISPLCIEGKPVFSYVLRHEEANTNMNEME